MSITFHHTCPYCGTKKIGFTAVYNWSVRNEGDEKNILALCNGCRQGVIFLMRLQIQTYEFDFVKNGTGDLEKNKLRIVWALPKNSQDNVPESLPDAVDALYRQSLACIQQEAWDAAGMTLRKVLEVSTKVLKPDSAGLTLVKRIDKLAEDGVISAEIKAWSHEIRLDGNDAVHDEVLFDRDRAIILCSFVESYLRYVYTLPAMVSANRERRK